MPRKGTVEINGDINLAWESWGEVEYGGRNCAFRFFANVLTQKKDPAGYFEGNILFPDRLGDLDLWNVCVRISPPLGALAEEIMEYRMDLYEFRFFYFDRLEIEPPFRGQLLGPAALRTIAQIGGESFGVKVCILKPYPLQYQGQPDLMADPGAFKRDKRKMTSYFRKHLPIRPLRKGSAFYFWRLD